MDELYRAFLLAAGIQAGETKFALSDLLGDLGEPQVSAAAAAAVSRSKSQTATDSTSKTQGSSAGSDGTVVQVLKSGLGVAPLIGGLISLFGGGDEGPAPLVKYALPASVAFQGAETA